MGFLLRKKKSVKASGPPLLGGASRPGGEGQKVYHSFDLWLLFVTLLLVLVGIVMVFSSSAVLAQQNYRDTYYFLKKQIFFLVLGLALLFMTKRVSYRLYWKWVYPLFFLSTTLLLMTLLFGHGGRSGDVHRWLSIFSFSVQPSEFAKLAVVIFLAYGLAKKGDAIKNFTTGFFPIVFLAGIVVLLILAQKDLGGAFIAASLILLMLFVSGARLLYLAGIILSALPVLYFAIFSVDFRRERIMTFLDPWSNPLGSGFQIIQSFVAFKSGGLTGVGLGEGKQKLFYLPEAHTDFIFSVLGEELGLLGVLGVIALFTFFVFRGLLIALKTRDLFGMYLAFGITCLIGIEAFFNMGVVMGLLPTKGLTLPFISYGGSSLVTNLVAVGILLNISTDTGEEF